MVRAVAATAACVPEDGGGTSNACEKSGSAEDGGAEGVDIVVAICCDEYTDVAAGDVIEEGRP